MINSRRLVNTFKQLVRIDSLSLKEGKLASFLKKELASLGLKVQEVGKPKEGEVGNLMLDLPGEGERILLNAHLDTVTPGEKIKPVEKNGYIYSDGKTILGADNKAGVAAILEVLRVIKEKKLAHRNLRVIFTVAEEIGLVGAKALPQKFISADFGIALDGGDIHEIIHKAPSQINLAAKVIGRAAHAGVHPEEGINAIKVASQAIAGMKLGRINKDTTANIGVIKGGKATNIVPDEVEMKGEARSHSPFKLKKQVSHMRQALKRSCTKAKAKLIINTGQVYRSFDIKKEHRVLKLAMSAVRKVGIKPILKQTGGGSDANIFNAAGVPTIIMGVGADHVHTTKERLKVADLIKGTEIVLGLCA